MFLVLVVLKRAGIWSWSESVVTRKHFLCSFRLLFTLFPLNLGMMTKVKGVCACCVRSDFYIWTKEKIMLKYGAISVGVWVWSLIVHSSFKCAMVIEWFRVQQCVSCTGGSPAKMFCYINKVQINPPPPPSLKCFDIATNRATSLIIMDVFIEEIFECTKQGQ